MYMFVSNNASAQSSAGVVMKPMGLGVRYSPYSADLVLSNYCLLTNMKKLVAEKKCYSNEDVIAETNVHSRGRTNHVKRKCLKNCNSFVPRVLF